MDVVVCLLIVGAVLIAGCLALALYTYICDRIWLARFFRDFKPAPKPQPAAADEKPWCGNCKHTNKSFDEDPCCYCDKNSEWEPKL